MEDPVQYLINELNEWGGWGHQNSQLELAVRVLELRESGFDISPLKPIWEKQRDSTRLSPGIFLRSPKGKYSSDMANSHDNFLGICILSYIFDNGATAKEIEDKGLVFGLWLTGRNEKGKLIDSEWFTYWRPEYRAFIKLAQGKKLTYIERTALDLNLLISQAWNVKRVRLLFLKEILPDNKPNLLTKLICKLSGKHIYNNVGVQHQSESFMMDSYKGRYGEDPLLLHLWSLNSK